MVSEDSSPPAQPIYREDNHLFVPPGADLSQVCLVCCEPTKGPKIKCRLSAVKWATRHPGAPSGSSLLLIWDLIAWMIGAIWWWSDHAAREQRLLFYGLCRKHRFQYSACRWGALWGSLLGLPALIIALFCEKHLPA